MIEGLQPDFWQWWILALLLVILEMFVPGTFFLWMGVSAVLVGGLVWVYPAMGWEIQLLLFALLSLASIVFWRQHLRRHPQVTDQPTLNRRGEQYVGRVFEVEVPIVNGYGKVRVGDSLWRVRGEDAPAGARVKVTAVDGVVFVAESVDD